MFTLIGGGIKNISQSVRPMSSVLPKNALWLQDAVTEFKPESNKISTNAGNEITYEYMIIALGIEMHYERVSISFITPLNTVMYSKLTKCTTVIKLLIGTVMLLL